MSIIRNTHFGYCYSSSRIRTYKFNLNGWSSKGAFINDVTQLGERGCLLTAVSYLCNHMFMVWPDWCLEVEKNMLYRMIKKSKSVSIFINWKTKIVKFQLGWISAFNYKIKISNIDKVIGNLLHLIFSHTLHC